MTFSYKIMDMLMVDRATEMLGYETRSLDGIGLRRCLMADDIFAGQMPIYEREERAISFVSRGPGFPIERYTGCDSVLLPRFELVSRYPGQLEWAESREIARLISGAVPMDHRIAAETNLFDSMREASDLLDDHGLEAKQMICGPSVFGAIKSHMNDERVLLDTSPSPISLPTPKMRMFNGRISRINLVSSRRRWSFQYGLWNVDVILSSHIPPDTIYVMGAPEYVGVISITQHPTVIGDGHDDSIVFEEISLAVINDASLVSISVPIQLILK
jgi:hypothetical protein